MELLKDLPLVSSWKQYRKIKVRVLSCNPATKTSRSWFHSLEYPVPRMFWITLCHTAFLENEPSFYYSLWIPFKHVIIRWECFFFFFLKKSVESVMDSYPYKCRMLWSCFLKPYTYQPWNLGWYHSRLGSRFVLCWVPPCTYHSQPSTTIYPLIALDLLFSYQELYYQFELKNLLCALDLYTTELPSPQSK